MKNLLYSDICFSARNLNKGKKRRVLKAKIVAWLRNHAAEQWSQNFSDPLFDVLDVEPNRPPSAASGSIAVLPWLNFLIWKSSAARGRLRVWNIMILRRRIRKTPSTDVCFVGIADVLHTTDFSPASFKHLHLVFHQSFNLRY